MDYSLLQTVSCQSSMADFEVDAVCHSTADFDGNLSTCLQSYCSIPVEHVQYDS